MIKRLTRQNGSSSFIFVILVLVVGAIGAAAFLLHQKNDDKQAGTESSTKASSSSSTQQSQTKYLEIKELGVKIALTDNTKDIAYHLGEGGSDGVRSVSFGLSTFTAVSLKHNHLTDNDGRNSCENMATLIIYPENQRQLIEQDPIMPHKFDANGKPLDDLDIKQLADKRYAVLRGPQATCLKDGTEDVYAQESRTKAALQANVLKNLSNL